MTHNHPANVQIHDDKSLADRAADWSSIKMSSWGFIFAQTAVVGVWVAVNMVLGKPWDPYPFILLTLALSLQAAYATPLLLLSQNRQTEHDRQRAEEDYRVNQAALQLLHAIAKDLNIAVPEEDK